jgi:hypothetical protein
MRSKQEGWRYNFSYFLTSWRDVPDTHSSLSFARNSVVHLTPIASDTL